MTMCRILFVDDDKDILMMVEQYLQMQGYDITTVNSGLKALDLVKDQDIDIIFTDYKMPEFNGLELLAAVKQYKPEIEVIVVTGYGSMESAIQAMKFGSYDYLQKPFKLDHLKLIIDRITEEKKVKDKAELIRKRGRERHKFEGLVGVSPRMQQIYELIETVSRQDPMVLIQGESGTGKELVARTIHHCGHRRDNAFVPVNCGGITEGVPEEQLVAHVTALMQRVQGGTLYLDEIAELALSALDHKLRQQMQIELKQLQRKLGITFVYVTHDQEEALSMSDRVMVMHNGQAQQVGTPREIYESPRNLFVARFIGESNVFAATILRDLGDYRYVADIYGVEKEIRTSQRFETGEQVNVILRPEDLRIDCSTDTIRQGFPGKVTERNYTGQTLNSQILLENGLTVIAHEFFDEDDPDFDYRINQQVGVDWVAGWEHVIRAE
jgi:CheY-like chemotaxis protein